MSKMGKEKMPSVKQLLKKKVLYDKKKDPVWVYLEKEMMANIDKKPYNEKVGRWLRFLKDLKQYQHCEEVFELQRLSRAAGPKWYVEYSSIQREVLKQLKSAIHQDLLAELPSLVEQSLSDIGVTLRIPKPVLMKAMSDSNEDPGLFMWYLYEAIYRTSPSVLQPKYNMNARLLMSSLVFIDLDECIQSLKKLTEYKKIPATPKKKKQGQCTYVPDCRFGLYLQRTVVPLHSNYPSSPRKPPKTLPLGCELNVRNKESYKKLRLNSGFIDKRKERIKVDLGPERICTYKFWEPPPGTGDPNQALATAMKKKPNKRFKTEFANKQFQVTGISFTGMMPSFILSGVVSIPTAYIPINGGVVLLKGERIMNILGFWMASKKTRNKCTTKCKCLEKWEKPVMNHLKKSSCKCGHYYDLKTNGTCKEKYFYPATKHGSYWVDSAKVFQLDPVEDFIKERVEENLATPKETADRLVSTNLTEEQLLQLLLSDLSDTALIIPHLPQANRLNSLKEWVRLRVQGKLTREQKAKHRCESSRSWVELNHLDFRARSWLIPFTQKELGCMTWKHKDMLKEMEAILKDSFVTRNRLKQLEQSRLLWPTTKYDAYPGKPFLDIFYTYMPGRMKETHLLNPAKI